MELIPHIVTSPAHPDCLYDNHSNLAIALAAVMGTQYPDGRPKDSLH